MFTCIRSRAEGDKRTEKDRVPTGGVGFFVVWPQDVADAEPK
jgi:hypothetical protein